MSRYRKRSTSHKRRSSKKKSASRKKRCSPGTHRVGKKCVASRLRPLNELAHCKKGLVRKTSPPRRCVRPGSLSHSPLRVHLGSPVRCQGGIQQLIQERNRHIAKIEARRKSLTVDEYIELFARIKQLVGEEIGECKNVKDCEEIFRAKRAIIAEKLRNLGKYNSLDIHDCIENFDCKSLFADKSMKRTVQRSAGRIDKKHWEEKFVGKKPNPQVSPAPPAVPAPPAPAPYVKH